MNPLNATVWTELQARRPRIGVMTAKRVSVDAPLYVAVDHLGHRHALIPVDRLDNGMSDQRSRGLAVSTETLVVEGRPESPYVDMHCTDSTFSDAFDVVVGEIHNRITNGTPPVEAVRITLARWRRFWSALPAAALGPEAARGLFGEIWFLRVWLLPRRLSDVYNWVGPTGARHDFQWQGHAVEVKTTTSGGHVHRINGLEQLEPPDEGLLYVFSLRLREESSAHNDLPSLVQSISSTLSHAPQLLDHFETLLAQAGYSPVHDDIYRQWRYRVAAEGLYVVGEEFPRLTPNSFVSGPPPGVERVEYVINLDICPHLCIGRSPTDPGLPLP